MQRSPCLKCLVVLLLMLFTAPGCIRVSKNMLEVLDKLPVAAVRNEKLNVSVHFTYDWIYQDSLADVSSRDSLEKEFIGVLERSGYFSSVRTAGLVNASEDGDLHINVHLTWDGPTLNRSTSLLLLFLPGQIDQYYNLDATVYQGPHRRHDFHLRDGWSFLVWIPFVIAQPFSADLADLRENLYKHLLVRMARTSLVAR